jgi:hypothetical protein
VLVEGRLQSRFTATLQQLSLNLRPLSLKHLLQLAALLHLLDDIETADKLALDDELRERGPLVEFLELCEGEGGQFSLNRSGEKGEKEEGTKNALCRTPSSLRMSKVV